MRNWTVSQAGRYAASVILFPACARGGPTSSERRLAATLSPFVAPTGLHGRPDRGGRRHSQGDGVRHDRRAAGAHRPVHRPRADGRLRPARHVAAAQRQHDHDDRHPGRGGARDAVPGRRRRGADRRGRHARRAGRLLLVLARCSASVSSPTSSPTRCSPGSSPGSAWSSSSTSSPKLLGVHFDEGRLLPGSAALAQQLPETSLPTLLLARGAARAAGRPGALRAASAGAAGRGRGWHRRVRGCSACDAMGVATVGTGAGRAAVVWCCRISPSSDQMWPAAVGIALMSFTETIAAGPRVRRGGRAAARAESGTAGARAPPTWRAASSARCRRAAAPRRRRSTELAGARTQVAALVTAAMAAGHAAAARPRHRADATGRPGRGGRRVYSVELIKPAEFAAIRRVRQTEFRWALTAFAGVVAAGHAQRHPRGGDRVAARRSRSRPTTRRSTRWAASAAPRSFARCSPEHPDDETWPGLLILRIEGRLFFANAERVADRVRVLVDRRRPRVLVFDCRAIFDIEYTALQMLDRGRGATGRRGDRASGWPGSTPSARGGRRSPLGERLGRERMFFNLEAAVARVRAAVRRASRSTQHLFRSRGPTIMKKRQGREERQEAQEAQEGQSRRRQRGAGCGRTDLAVQDAKGGEGHGKTGKKGGNSDVRRRRRRARAAKEKLKGKAYARSSRSCMASSSSCRSGSSTRA